jgi:hypothetical protein
MVAVCLFIGMVSTFLLKDLMWMPRLAHTFPLCSLTGPSKFVISQPIPISKRRKDLLNHANQDRIMKGGDTSPTGVSQKLTFNFLNLIGGTL